MANKFGRVSLVALGLFTSLSIAHAGDTLYAGQELRNGSLISSPNGRYSLIMQTDGSLVMYRNDGSIRYAMEKHGTHAVMQTDGNFVEYQNSTALWSTGTYNCCFGYPVWLTITDNGNLQINWGSSGTSWSMGGTAWEIGRDPIPAPVAVYPLQALQPPGTAPGSPPYFEQPPFVFDAVASNLDPRH